ncbi:YdcH family protein [Sandaracinus amylolyticus]|uniref:YdcH family protein n=1 Tax=Sandaracinus amylolyticus TaxID=927083 RepID=UPI001F357EEC|nr:YdcH family protein [Sandaracinus amylolyticus]UJR79237.1 Hypothetical protein I5071_12700 [Sandaracinus amylolyticus]
MARSQSRQVDPLKELDRLERRHKKLKERVAEYEARMFLTNTEQLDLAKLKKQKLATKDAMENLRVPSS